MIMQQTSTIIILQPHPSQREEEVLSHYNWWVVTQLLYTAQLNLPLLSCLWMSEYHLQKAQLVMATFCCGSDLMVADSSPFCARDEANPLWQINGILVWLWLEIRKCLWLQFLHKTALQLIHHSVSLQSAVFTSSTSSNDFGSKGQFSCLIVHVCLQESNRKGQQFGVTIGTCAGSYQQK